MSSTLVLPQIEIKRALPSGQSYVGKTAEIKLIDYGKAHVNNDGFVIRGLNLMKETYPSWAQYPKFYHRQKLIKNLYFKSKIKNLKSTAILTVVDGAVPGYGHWMYNNLPRINLVKKILPSDFLLVLPKACCETDFYFSSLKMIGINSDRVVAIDKREAAKSDHVFFPTFIFEVDKTVYGAAIVQLRDDLLTYCKSNNKLNFNCGDKIFISRGKQAKRKILNQGDVDSVMQKYGFSIVYMEDLSFEDKISVAYNAKYIVGQVGTVLTNIIFAQKGTKVLELFPKKNYDLSHTLYRDVAQDCELHHYFQYCPIDPNNIVINEFHTDMFVDVVELEKNIQAML